MAVFKLTPTLKDKFISNSCSKTAKNINRYGYRSLGKKKRKPMKQYGSLGRHPIRGTSNCISINYNEFK